MIKISRKIICILLVPLIGCSAPVVENRNRQQDDSPNTLQQKESISDSLAVGKTGFWFKKIHFLYQNKKYGFKEHVDLFEDVISSCPSAVEEYEIYQNELKRSRAFGVVGWFFYVMGMVYTFASNNPRSDTYSLSNNSSKITGRHFPASSSKKEEDWTGLIIFGVGLIPHIIAANIRNNAHQHLMNSAEVYNANLQNKTKMENTQYNELLHMDNSILLK